VYSLRLYHESIPAGVKAEPLYGQHMILYVLKGSALINGEAVPPDEAKYCVDVAQIEAGEEGAVIWRFELIPTAAPFVYLSGDGIESVLKMYRRVRMFDLAPRTRWLFRLDCIINHEGSTGLHSHPGSGIRCLLDGNLHVRGEIGEESDNVKQGDTWYEEGSYPIVSTADPGTKATFLRGMILPVEYSQYPDTAIWLEEVKPCESSWKGLAQEIVRLR